MSDVFDNLMDERREQLEAEAKSGMDDNTQQTQESTENPETQAEGSGMEDKPQETNTIDEKPEEKPEIQQPDYVSWLKEKSGGIFEDETSFVSALDKFKKYDELLQQKETLEKNQMPEDQFLKNLADLRGKGASQDQIKEFIKINTEYADLESLDPMEVKIAKMVLIDGYSQRVARSKVEKEFGLSDLEEGTDEYEEAKEDLMISSKNDLNALNAYKSKITTVEHGNIAEQAKLQEQAIMNAHKATVKESVPLILGQFTGVGQVALKESVDGKEVVSEISIDYDDDFKAMIPEMLEGLLSQDIEPITKESIDKAHKHIRALYLEENFPKILNNAFKNGMALAAEIADEKYVNHKGLKPEESNRDISKDAALQAEIAAFEKEVANWR